MSVSAERRKAQFIKDSLLDSLRGGGLLGGGLPMGLGCGLLPSLMQKQ